MKFALMLSTLFFLPAPALAYDHSFGGQTNVYEECKRYIHKERYIPGSVSYTHLTLPTKA